MNELIFIFHSAIIGGAAIVALSFGQSALVAFVCIQCLLANFFVIKQTTLFGLSATCADAYTVGATIGLNLLQEYFGRSITKKTIWINFFLLIFYAVVSQIHLWYGPSPFDNTQVHYQGILAFAPRIITASFLVYLLVQLIDYKLYGFLKDWFSNRFLLIRNYLSIIICQFIDTVLFSFLGLYGIIEEIWEVVFISYAVKLIAILIATPLVAFSKKIHKKNSN